MSDKKLVCQMTPPCQASDAMECNRLRYAGHPNPAIRTAITPCTCQECHPKEDTNDLC